MAGAFAMVVAVFGVVVLLDSCHQRTVAQEFLDVGVPAMADRVRLHVDHGRGGDFIDEVDVVFVVSAEVRLATLTNSLGDPEGNESGVHSPNPGTRYAPPLAVLYRPQDPSEVIAVVDAQEFAGDSETPAVAAAMIAVGGSTAIAVGIGAMLNGRLRSRLRRG